MTDLEKYIKNYFGVTQEDLAAIVSFFKPQTLEKGDFFSKRGGGCDKLSFIRTGLVRVFVRTEKKEVTQWIGGQGYFIADLGSLIFHKPARWNIQSLTDCELYTINGNDYRNLGRVISKWHELEKIFIAKCFMIMEDRIFQFISMSSEERYKILMEQQPELFNQVPLQYLASMIGMTPETFSRIRSKRLD